MSKQNDKTVEESINPCTKCIERVGNGGIPTFYESTESDSVDHIYPAKVQCEQCGHSVHCGTTWESAVREWNIENPRTAQAVEQSGASQAEIPARPEARHINQFQPALSSFYYVLYAEFAEYADEVERQLRQVKAELEEARDAFKGQSAGLSAALKANLDSRARAESAEAKLAVTTEALRKMGAYTAHYQTCQEWMGVPCDCGLTQLQSEAKAILAPQKDAEVQG